MGSGAHCCAPLQQGPADDAWQGPFRLFGVSSLALHKTAIRRWARMGRPEDGAPTEAGLGTIALHNGLGLPGSVRVGDGRPVGGGVSRRRSGGGLGRRLRGGGGG